MAKIGYEVEGKYANQGILTYFCSAEEYLSNEYLHRDLYENRVDMIYISDHLNILDLQSIADTFNGSGIKVTVELTQLDDVPPVGVEIFWNASQASYAQAKTILPLRNIAQIKVEHNKHVMAWTVGNSVLTLPVDFEGDIEV